MLQSLEYLLKVVQMFLFCTASNQNIINIAEDMGYALEDSVHGSLEHRMC